jgi:hypothetical protein
MKKPKPTVDTAKPAKIVLPSMRLATYQQSPAVLESHGSAPESR